ncbi:DENN domain-containing protein 1C [Seminavis robusta]|uniref:DENN domain-containing protein 1C n=1 Tax=Seminavis robusta TaxID=568900 RepID=A0A9N8D922_9STRA|nr:DENN domain-containing protein 1C [Seminavis robusta]|eukprot:Sro2_g001360.1 DENN domain-containing protein 1C (1464) ;mRNA; r:128381-132940
MSKEEEEFGVAWSNVDDNDLFANDDDDDAKGDVMDEAEEATHPSSQFTAGQSSDDEASSVEEEAPDTKADGAFPDDDWDDANQSRPSWVTDEGDKGATSSENGTGEEGQSQDGGNQPPPFSPEPVNVGSCDVQRLSSGSSRLAGYSGDLKLRFSENTTDSNNAKEEDDGFQESPWPGDDVKDEDDEDEDANREAEGGDAFSSEVRHTAKKEPAVPSQSLTKELSTNWMKFDDDKWDSSKHDSRHEKEEGDTGPQQSPNIQAPKGVLKSSMSSGKKKKKNGKQSFSLEAGLAKVNEATKDTAPTGPQEEQKGGEQANELISFWGEGSAEEEDADDPLAMALKAKPPEQHERQSRYNDAAIFTSPKTQLSPEGGTNQTEGPGWLQKGMAALDRVTSNLPFNKPKEEEDRKVEEDNVVEVDDMPFPNYTNTHPAAAAKPQPHPMHDLSAMSDDSALVPNYGRRERAAEIASTFDSADPQIKNALKALPDGMNAQAENNENSRIKFSKETKKESKVFHATPIFDLCMDLPHPAADASCAPASLIGAPSSNDKDVKIQSEIQDCMKEITCMAFPDYDTAILAQDDDSEPRSTPRYALTILEVPGFQYHTFSLHLKSGALVLAHVRRYLPPHKEATFRHDIGRRLCRAMVVLTRYPGGDDMYLTILKTLDAVASQHHSRRSLHVTRPQKWFLHNLYQKHQRLCAHYAANNEERRGGPHIITLQGLEFADCMEFYSAVDTTHFFLPNNLLHDPVVPGFHASYHDSVLPLIRCLGVVNSLRLLSALLSERRVIMVSVSPTRLDRNVRAAIAMLAQGMLNWPHQCIPVLPPDLWSKLKSPSPYIMGVQASLAYRLELTDQLGDVAVFNLDENTITAMGEQKLAKLIPDLCRSLSETMLQKRRIALPENVATEKDMTAMAILNSTSDFLAQDLVEIMKSDKQTMNGTAVAAKHVAKTAKKAVKSTLKYLLGSGEKEEGEEAPDVKKSKKEKRTEPDAVFIEGCRNEAAEEAVRLAFVSFFVRILGNVEGYAIQTEDSEYEFDRDFFLQQRKERGDGQGSPMWTLLLHFCETRIVRDFVRLREEHIRKRQPIPMDAPLFWQCIDFLEVKNIDFGILNVRSVARMMLQKSSVHQMLPSNVRRLAMALTSKRKFEGHLDDAVADLAELSRESCSALYDVMSVVWLRARNSKGLQWVHGYQAMRVLKAVLLHGPLAAVADATDGLHTIRTLAYRKSQGCEQIQAEAMEIYNLLADRSRLFLRRGVAAEQRRHFRDPDELPLVRDTRLNLKSPFKEMHAIMNPSLRPPEPQRRRASLSSRRASLSNRLPHRLSITKHMMALEPMDGSMSSFPQNVLPMDRHANRHNEFLQDPMQRNPESVAGSVSGEFASARRYVREIARKTQEEEKERTREDVRRRDSNAMGVELLKKQFMLLKVAIYLGPVFYIFGNHEHFLTVVMFVWLSQQLQVFRAPIDSGTY